MGTYGRVPRLVAETVIGWLLIVAGIVMLVTPGPGLVALLAGLAVLARHYRWAEWLKVRTLTRVHDSATRLRAHRAARRAGGEPEADAACTALALEGGSPVPGERDESSSTAA
jgi:UPF0716 family protein affecting phage T7 exclusion